MKKQQKLTHKNRFKPFSGKKNPFLIVILTGILLFLCIIPVSASDWMNYDNYKVFEKGELKYGKITIYDKSLIGDDTKLLETTLKENTEECILGRFCYATGETTLYENNYLISNLRFEINEVKWSEVYIKEKGIWIIYNDEVLSVGTYEWKIEAEKYNGFDVDWIAEFGDYDIESSEWALWTGEDKPAGYWSFNEGTGTNAKDNATSQHNGTLTGATWTAGKISNAVNYDGVGDHVDANDPASMQFERTDSFSLQAWFYRNSTGSTENIIATGNAGGGDQGYSIRLNQTGGIEFILTGTGVGSQLKITTINSTVLNSWQHVVVVYNGSSNPNQVLMYVNGTTEGFTINTNTLSDTTIGTKLIFGAQDDGTVLEFTGGIDEIGIWNRSLTSEEVSLLWNNGDGLAFEGLDITLNFPDNGHSQIGEAIAFNISSSTSIGTLVNITLFIDGLRNETSVLSGTSAETIFNKTIPLGNYNWSVEVCTNIISCTLTVNRTLTRANLVEGSSVFNGSTFETAQEFFSIDFMTNGSVLTVPRLFYNGSFLTATSVNTGGDNYTLSKTLQISINNGTRKFKWNFLIDGIDTNSTEQTQQVGQTIFDLCNTTFTTRYINFSFRNETLGQEHINASFDSNFQYWLGDGTVNKTLNFLNISENRFYTFCFSPSNKGVRSKFEIRYNNIHSQQRTFLSELSLFTNVTANQILYLLPTSLGLFSPFQTVTSTGDPISNVKAIITRLLGSTTITSTIGFTDGSGFVTFFLNPDQLYTGTFSKSGFEDVSVSFTPSTTTRTVIMGGGLVGVGNGTQIVLNTTYQITPFNSSLNNNTDYVFGFNVTSDRGINFISMNITNISGFQLGFQSGTSAGFISEIINTGNHTRIIGRYVIKSDSETITTSKIWTVGVEFIGDYSIFNQFTLFLTYNFKDFLRILIVLMIVIGTLIFMSAGEITDTSESKIAVALLLIWVFSLLGWLDTGLLVNSANSNINILGKFSSQYGIAILSTAAGSFFLLRRIFIRRI